MLLKGHIETATVQVFVLEGRLALNANESLVLKVRGGIDLGLWTVASLVSISHQVLRLALLEALIDVRANGPRADSLNCLMVLVVICELKAVSLGILNNRLPRGASLFEISN